MAVLGMRTDTWLKTFATRFCNYICTLMYLAGVIGFLLLAYRPMNNGTYISEHALLPGLVDSDFRESDASKSAEIYREVSKSATDKQQQQNFMADAFTQLGLDVHQHNFTYRKPFVVGGEAVAGTNIHAVVRAPRAASTEAVVMFTTYSDTKESVPHASLAIMHALARHFRKQQYWAKDIIFLIADHGNIGLQAWLDAYHSTNLAGSYITSESLIGRGGTIQAAVGLEFFSDRFLSIDVQLEGLNGQMPNLDLVSMAFRLCRKSSVPTTLLGKRNHNDPESKNGFLRSLTVMLGMFMNQASGVGTGGHALFQRYRIEAVTLKGLTNRRGHNSFYELGTIVDGIFRSLNNLLERFHQSFFFYLLPATNRYISIGLYMIPFGLVAAGTAIKAFTIWVQLTSTDKNSEDENADVELEEEKSAKFADILPVVLAAHLLACLVPYSCDFAISSGYIPQDMLAPVLITLILGFVFLAPMALPKKNTKDEEEKIIIGQSLKCVALVELGIILFGISLLNFSLAMYFSVMLVPVMIFMQRTASKMLSFVQTVLLVAVSPLTLTLLAGTILFGMRHGMAKMDSSIFSDVFHEVLVPLVHSQYTFQAWSFIAVSFWLLPVWFTFLFMLHL